MPEITGISEKRNRARLYVDGDFFAEIDPGAVLDYGLYKGLSLSQEELEEARLAGEKALAMSRAFHYLGYRARSVGEVEERLFRYGYGERTVGEVVERLRELGYLDDWRFARDLASERSGKYGPRRVLSDLWRSGVDDSIARQAVDEEFSELSELEAARSAAERRYNTEEGSDALARRVHGFLARRGYSPGVCTEVAREYRRGE
ncbi:regulatory protein RecX [Rubrobacter aplysinae]|uniref:regulatory protein RecX n=1 Tax=Rubrobacter aplysinae TaxID=909625 RepID=UPI00069D54C5|nr:regulatory protein RecX [Rubrobacter aplysinae]